MHKIQFIAYWLLLMYRFSSQNKKRRGFRVDQLPELLLSDFGMFNEDLSMVDRYRLLSLFDLKRVTKNNSYIQNVTLDDYWYTRGYCIPQDLIPYVEEKNSRGRNLIKMAEWEYHYCSLNNKIRPLDAQFQERKDDFYNKDMKGLFSLYDYSQTRCSPVNAENMGMLKMVRRGLPQDLVIKVSKEAAALESIKPNTTTEATRLLILRSNLRLVIESKVRLSNNKTGFYSVPRGLKGVLDMITHRLVRYDKDGKRIKGTLISDDPLIYPISAIVAEWGSPLLTRTSVYPKIITWKDYEALLTNLLDDFQNDAQFACFMGLAFSHLRFANPSLYNEILRDKDVVRRLKRLRSSSPDNAGFNLMLSQVEQLHKDKALRNKLIFAKNKMDPYEYNILKGDKIDEIK